MTIRQQVEKAIAQNFPNETHLVDKLSDKAWTTYSSLINQYKSGADAPGGWYDTIRQAMLNQGVEKRTAHMLSHIKSDL